MIPLTVTLYDAHFSDGICMYDNYDFICLFTYQSISCIYRDILDIISDVLPVVGGYLFFDSITVSWMESDLRKTFKLCVEPIRTDVR